MNTVAQQRRPHGLAALRRFIAPKPRTERCEMCSSDIAEPHQHLVDPQRRRLLCVCDACAILFDHSGATSFRRVPRDIYELAEVNIGDAVWNGLGIPAGLVFLLRVSTREDVLALYPSPAGAAEALITEDVWRDLVAAHPAIARLKPDVEALLVNRTNGARDYFVVPVDECYRLTAVIRKHWHGFSGGEEAWQKIGEFLAGLRERAQRGDVRCYA